MKEKIINWLKENWFKLFGVILAITIGYFWFVRPIIYKKYCTKRTFELLKEHGWSTSDFDEVYKICLKKYGL